MLQTFDFNAIIDDARTVWDTFEAPHCPLDEDCPLDEVLLDYVYGDLAQEEYQTVSDHIGKCERCKIEVLKMETDRTEWEYSFNEDPDAALTKAVPSLKLSDIYGKALISALQLKEWFGNLFVGNWQPAELLLASAYRGPGDRQTEGTVKRAKAVILGRYKILVLVQLTPEAGEDVSVSLQIYPSGGNDYLPAGLQITVLDEYGNIFMDDESGIKNNMMELPWIREAGESYSIRLSLDGITITEDL